MTYVPNMTRDFKLSEKKRDIKTVKKGKSAVPHTLMLTMCQENLKFTFYLANM